MQDNLLTAASTPFCLAKARTIPVKGPVMECFERSLNGLFRKEQSLNSLLRKINGHLTVRNSHQKVIDSKGMVKINSLNSQ